MFEFTWLTHLVTVSGIVDLTFGKGELQAAKARGVKLGGARAEAEVRHIAVKAKADQFALRFADLIKFNRKAGKTYAWIADHLNELGVTTVNGSKWFPITVQRCAVRLSCGNTLG